MSPIAREVGECGTLLVMAGGLMLVAIGGKMNVSPIQVFEARLEGVHQAANRARTVFLVATVVASTTIASCFTTYFSWLRSFAHPGYRLANVNSNTYAIQMAAIKSWVDASFVTVPGLGAKLSITDAAIWASGGLFIAALWLFFCLRRENHLIGYVLADAYAVKGSVPGIYELVVHSVRASQVFATGTARTAPFSDMEDARKAMDGKGGGGSVVEAIPRAIVVGLMAMPALGCFCVLACDYLSVAYLPALYQGSDQSLGWGRVEGSYQYWVMVIFNVFMCGGCSLLGVHSARYQMATRKLVSATIGLLALEAKVVSMKSGDADSQREAVGA
ncbi:hypothetical protein ACQKGO_24675 [Corallococcus interemptor]|uniref:hypothetical protein n=1 Tax=Corallococcus interemptor TaxID=2316720 RepID=UPI003D027A59